MNLEIVVPDTDGFTSSFWDIVRSSKPQYEKRIKDLLETQAKQVHKYKSRTGNLKKATTTSGDLGKSIKLYVDTAKADYAKYVVEPRSSWGGDPFIEEALSSKQREIEEIIRELYDYSINKWNN